MAVRGRPPTAQKAAPARELAVQRRPGTALAPPLRVAPESDDKGERKKMTRLMIAMLALLTVTIGIAW
jgi:hypothetical protein